MVSKVYFPLLFIFGLSMDILWGGGPDSQTEDEMTKQIRRMTFKPSSRSPEEQAEKSKEIMETYAALQADFDREDQEAVQAKLIEEEKAAEKERQWDKLDQESDILMIQYLKNAFSPNDQPFAVQEKSFQAILQGLQNIQSSPVWETIDSKSIGKLSALKEECLGLEGDTRKRYQYAFDQEATNVLSTLNQFAQRTRRKNISLKEGGKFLEDFLVRGKVLLASPLLKDQPSNVQEALQLVVKEIRGMLQSVHQKNAKADKATEAERQDAHRRLREKIKESRRHRNRG